MPNTPEPTAPRGEEQAVTIGRETYVRNGTSWRHHHRWGPIVCDETSDILSRLSALHTELERTRTENERLAKQIKQEVATSIANVERTRRAWEAERKSLSSELERTRAALEGIAADVITYAGIRGPSYQERALLAESHWMYLKDIAKAALGSPDATTRRTE